MTWWCELWVEICWLPRGDVRGELITRTAAVLLCVGPGRRVGNVLGYALSVRIVGFDVVASGRSSESRCDGCDARRGRLHQLAVQLTLGQSCQC